MFSYQKSFVNPTLPVDEQQFYALVSATQWNDNIDKYRETGEASLKRKLPAFIFQAMFDETLSKNGKVGRWRKQAATRLTGLVVMDVDHVENPQKKFAEWKTLDFGALGILLIYITPSGYGLKIVFKADVAKGNLIDNQHAMAEVLGVEVDESCKDASRMSFICKESDILYIDKELFTYENKEFAEKYDAEYRAGHSGAAAPAAVAGKKAESGSETVGNVDAKAVSLTWRGYDVQHIIDCRYAGKLPCAADSNRHNESLKLASDLLVLFDGDRQKTLQALKTQPWVQEIIDERDENVEQTVASAAERMAEKEKKYLSQQPSKAMQEAIKEACGKTWYEITQGTQASAASVTDSDIERWLWEWGAQIEGLFEDFPLLRDICKGLKKNQFIAARHLQGLEEESVYGSSVCGWRIADDAHDSLHVQVLSSPRGIAKAE